MGGFFGGFAGGFGQSYAQLLMQKQQREIQAKHAELTAIGHLLDKPDLEPQARDSLTQRYLDVAGNMGGKHVKSILGRLLGREEGPPPRSAPGTFSEDTLTAPPAPFTDTGAAKRAQLPAVPGAAAPAAMAEPPPPLPGLTGIGLPAAAGGTPIPDTTPPPVSPSVAPLQGGQPVARSLPPVPTDAAGGRFFMTPEEVRARKIADAEAMAGVQTRAKKAQGANATAERVALETQLEPLREKQRNALEQARKDTLVAVQKARNEGRMVKAGKGPKEGGEPWEFTQRTVYADGSITETPADAPIWAQQAFQIAASKAAANGTTPREEWDKFMIVKGKAEESKAKGAEARATQTEMRNKGTLPPMPRAGSTGAPKPKDFAQIEKTKDADLAKVEQQHNARRQAVEANRNLTGDQRANLLKEIESQRASAKAQAQQKYLNSINAIKGTGGGGPAPQQTKTATKAKVLEFMKTNPRYSSMGYDAVKKELEADGWKVRE